MYGATDQDPRDDRELIAAFVKGSEQCYVIIYNRYVSKIYRFIYYMLGNHQSAQDLTQDVFLHLYHKASMYKPTGTFSSWLYRMAKNITLNYIKKNKNIKKSVSIEPPGDSDTANSMHNLLKDDKPEPHESAVSREMKERVEWGLTQLKEADREVVLLCDIQEIPHKEAAQIIGCTLTNLDVKLYRARKRLAQIIGMDTDLLQG